MNEQRLKREFLKLVEECAKPLDEPVLEPGKLAKSSFPFRLTGGVFLTGPSVDIFAELLQLACSEVASLPDRGGWNESTISDLIGEFLAEAISIGIESGETRAKELSQHFVTSLQSAPQLWEITLPVFGMSPDCGDISFGCVTFSDGSLELSQAAESPLPTRSASGGMLATLQVRGRDTDCAVERASSLLEQHLAVLNALCCTGYPSRTRLTSDSGEYHSHRFYRAKQADSPDQSSGSAGRKSKITRLPLARADFEKKLSERGGERVSSFLKNPTEFGKRLISAYMLAGTAAIDNVVQRSFMLFSIAVESVVLANTTKTEIAFQLSIHLANLLGDGLEGKRAIRKEVNRLYGIRSAIAHAGKTEIPQEEVEHMRRICMLTLLSLTSDPAFAAMTQSEELDAWLVDRLLDSQTHLKP